MHTDTSQHNGTFCVVAGDRAKLQLLSSYEDDGWGRKYCPLLGNLQFRRQQQTNCYIDHSPDEDLLLNMLVTDGHWAPRRQGRQALLEQWPTLANRSILEECRHTRIEISGSQKEKNKLSQRFCPRGTVHLLAKKNKNEREQKAFVSWNLQNAWILYTLESFFLHTFTIVVHFSLAISTSNSNSRKVDWSQLQLLLISLKMAFFFHFNRLECSHNLTSQFSVWTSNRSHN